MGKWAEVHCNCPNRIPLAGGAYFDQPHQRKRRLTAKQKAEVEEWERTTKDMLVCGHRNGNLIEFWPGDIVHLGSLIASIFRDKEGAFELFGKVGDWRCYEDELLLVTPDRARLWLLEIEEVQQALLGLGNLDRKKTARLLLDFYQNDLGSRLDLEHRIEEAAAKIPSDRILKDNVERTARPDLETTLQKIQEALTDAARLCHVSVETGSTIRLLW